METGSHLGRWCYAIAIVAFGVLHVVHLDFVTRVVPWWPGWMPGRAASAAGVGIVLIGAGAAIAIDLDARRVALTLGGLILLSFLFLGLPSAAADSVLGGMWTRAGKALALSGGAFLVALASAGGNAARWLVALGSMGRRFFGVVLAMCGVQHFVHLTFVTSLVPSWIPAPVFWAEFAGVALIAGGVGVIVRRTAQLAGLLSGLMIFAWVLMLHIPRAYAAGTGVTNETTAAFEALAMSGIGLLCAVTAAEGRWSFLRWPLTRSREPVTTM